MNVQSVKDRLKNYAKETNKPYQEVLTYYALERTIYRLSLSEYAENFVLKGGIFLYAIHDKNYVRATTDIDMMAQRLTNDAVKMRMIFSEILSIKIDDALKYDPDTLKVNVITEFKEYHGLNVSVVALLDRTRIPVTIDIGYDDVIIPEKVRMSYPTILDMDAPEVYVYSLESVIAEKFEAIVSNGLLNSRYKDFYDIFVLSRENCYDGNLLAKAIIETFEHRRTALSADVSAFTEDYYRNSINETRWNAFLKKKKVLLYVSLETVVKADRDFLIPLINRTKAGETDSDICWNNEKGVWE